MPTVCDLFFQGLYSLRYAPIELELHPLWYYGDEHVQLSHTAISQAKGGHVPGERGYGSRSFCNHQLLQDSFFLFFFVTKEML